MNTHNFDIDYLHLQSYGYYVLMKSMWEIFCHVFENVNKTDFNGTVTIQNKRDAWRTLIRICLL